MAVQKIRSGLISLFLLHGIIIASLRYAHLIDREGTYNYILMALGGLLLVALCGLLATVGLGFVRSLYYRFLLISGEAMFHPEVIWNNPFVRSTLYWGLMGALIGSAYPWLAIVLIIVQLVWLFKSGLAHINWNKFEPEQSSPLSYGFQTNQGPLRIDNLFRGLLVVGGAGSGKSRSLIEPVITQAGQKGFTGVVYDYKFPVLAEVVSGAYADHGPIRKYYINFTDLPRSHRVNPLEPQLLENGSYARELASAVIANLDPQAARKRDFWIQSAEALLTGTIWYLREEQPLYCTLPHAVSLLLTTERKRLIELLQTNVQVAGMIASVASAMESENTLGGMFATLQNQLGVLNTPEIFWVMSGNDLTLDLNNPQEGKILVLGNHPQLSNTYSPLLSLIATAALKQLNQAGRLPSMVLLDEAPTMIIPRFDELPATARSNQVATIVVAQDLAQLEDRYGHTQTETIIANLGNQAYGRTTNPKTAERISKLFGREERIFEGRSVSVNPGGGASASRSQSLQQRDRIQPQDAMRFPTGTFAGLIAEGNQTEFICRFKDDKSSTSPLPVIRPVSPEQIRQNFRQIYDQAQLLLTGAAVQEKNDRMPDSFLDL